METCNWPRVMNSGMVIIERIGQPAWSEPKDAKLVNGSPSETEREWVINEDLSNLRWLKVQSGPLGNQGGYSDGRPRFESNHVFRTERKSYLL